MSPQQPRPEQLRRVRLFTIMATLGLIACSSTPGDKNAQQAPASGLRPATTLVGDPGACKLITVDQWQDFVSRNAADTRWVDTCEDSECNAGFFDYVKQNIAGVLADCAPLLERNPPVASCTANLRRFVSPWMQQHNATDYGFTLSNHDYLAAETTGEKPAGMMDVPAELIAALPSRANVEETARVHGWKYLTHDSALGTVRTFIYIPDPAGRYDRWMLLNLSDDPKSIDTNIPLSLIGVQKTDGAGRKLEKIRLNFRDYDLVKSGTAVSLSLPEDRSGKCYSCHPSGLRRLIDRRTTTTVAKPVKGESLYDPSGTAPAPADFGFTRLSEFNHIIDNYGLPDWNGTIVPEDHGPALGADFGCTNCHNGQQRGLLTVSTSTNQLEQKIAVQLSMPPTAGLIDLLEKSQMRSATMTDADSKALQAAQDQHDDLTTAFEASRAPALTAWLQSQACQ